MRIERAEFAVYNARAFDLLKRWQEHRVPRRDVDAIAGPQPDSTTGLLGYEAEAIPLGLEDPSFIVERIADKCREHRSISGIHVFSIGPGLRIWDQLLLRPWCQCHQCSACVTIRRNRPFLSPAYCHRAAKQNSAMIGARISQ